jgi:hypothetical protein
MTYVTVLFIIMLTVFFGYVGAIWTKYGILHSISESYYQLPKNLKLLFTLFCWAFAFPAIIIGSNGLMFFAGSGICFVGAAAAFKEDLTKEVHFIGAALGVLLSQLAILFIYKLWIIPAIFVIFSLFMLFVIKKHTIWWIEIAAFLSICITYGIRLIF